jgi:hypothetical protein
MWITMLISLFNCVYLLYKSLIFVDNLSQNVDNYAFKPSMLITHPLFHTS